MNPPKEIDDPEDTKPEDWVDTKRIADPDATKVCIVYTRTILPVLTFRPA